MCMQAAVSYRAYPVLTLQSLLKSGTINTFKKTIRPKHEIEAHDSAIGENQSTIFKMDLLCKSSVDLPLTLPICITSQLAILTRAPSQIPVPTEAGLEAAWLVLVSARPMLNRPTVICTAYDTVHMVDSHFSKQMCKQVHFSHPKSQDCCGRC